MRNWHKLADSAIKRLIHKGTTLREILGKYKQPDWCNYPEALAGVMGCWSLTDMKSRHKISEEYCKDCDCFREEVQ